MITMSTKAGHIRSGFGWDFAGSISAFISSGKWADGIGGSEEFPNLSAA
jgi:hypothetical protein